MTQFLKKNAKTLYMVLFAFSLFILISAAFYITAYTGLAVAYDVDVLTGEKVFTASGNDALFGFAKSIERLGINFAYTYKDYGQSGVNRYFAILYRATFEFDQALQVVNNSLLSLGLFSLVMVAVMCICANASRKKYYISNLVSGIACPTATIIFTTVVLIQNLSALSMLNSNWELLNWVQLGNKLNMVSGGEYDGFHQAALWFKDGDMSHFELSSFSLIAFTVIFVLFILLNAAIIAYTVWRYKDTQKELRLEGIGE